MGNEASLEGEGQPGQPGGAVPAAGAPASISAPAGGGQLHKPSNGAPVGGTGTGHGPGINSIQGKPNQTDPNMGPKPSGPPGVGPVPGAPAQSQGSAQSQAAQKNLRVDIGSTKGGHPPSVSPVGSAPTSPYSLPQIAPMPSSKLCPVCKTADLTGTTDGQPNCNTCTQCRSAVCNQCGFNPNPHLTEVQEWLCLNCQMQRALGMDMDTPRSKSQQQIHSPSQPSKPHPSAQPQPQTQPHPPAETKKPVPQAVPQSKPPAPGAIPLPGMAKAPSQPDLSRSGPGAQPQAPRQDHTRSAGSSPSRQPPPPEQPFGKLFGFGASLLNQASNLMSVDPVQNNPPGQQPPSPKPLQKQGPPGPPQKQGPPGPGPAVAAKPAAQPGPPRQEATPKPKVLCPLCKTDLNVGEPAKPPNYNLCTECHSQVCNMCGFNPTPHLTEKKEWLCLTCQTRRAMSGSLGDVAPPAPPTVGSPRHLGPANQQQPRGPNQQAALRSPGPQQQKPPGAQVSGPFPPAKQGAPQSKGPPQQFPATKAETQKQDHGINKKQAMSKTEKEGDIRASSKKGTPDKKDEKRSSGMQKSKQDDDSNKSSTQSLSDTGYSSDGISSSQSEITGLIQEDSMKLNERGISDQRSPPSPSELTKLESSMRPLLESHTATDQHRDGRDSTRPRSLTITQDQEFESDEEASDDLSCKLRHDYVEDSSESGLSPLPTRQKKSQKDLRDEEFMRRQILEMSADEEEMADFEGHTKTKRTHKHSGELGKERRRLTQQSSSFEEDTKSTDATYKSSEADDMMASQGGLRRFKTIELNNTNSYNRDMELSTEHDLREPELEMESLTGSPEERSKGEYSSTLPATTPSYTSGTSPTSVSSMEDDSDSSPSRRQRLEEAKQQRKARHRSHGPLLPTIEDSSEEDELREEEELLKEQEKMRDLEQQRIRSTARKTKRDKEELRAQRRRERSKTPPSNLSPIEDASPTEELRQAAEMEELHRSSCSEYSPSMDSEAEGFEMGSKLYKSGSEYNLPTFMSLYSPTEKTSAVSPSAPDKSLKSAEEVYEEMMRKAELMQKQQQRTPGRQGQQGRVLQPDSKHHLDSGTGSLSPGTSPTQVSAPVPFSGNEGRGTQRVPGHSQQNQGRITSQTSKVGHLAGTPQSHVRQPAPTQPQGKQAVQGTVQGQVPDPGASSLTSKMFSYLKGSSPTTSPSASPTQSPTRTPAPTSTVAPTQTSQIHHRAGAPRLARQQSSQESPVIVITLASETSSQPTKPMTVNSSTSPLSSPTKDGQQKMYQTEHTAKSPTSPQKYQSPQHSMQRAHASPSVGSQGSGNISLCRISTVPGTSRVVEQGTIASGSNVMDLRAPMKPAPIIMTDQGMDLTSLASDTRRYSFDGEKPSSRYTAVQPLIMNLNAQAQPQVTATTPTTVSVTVAASMFISQPKQPVVYGDPLQNRVDFGQGAGSAVCLTQTRPLITDPTIPKIDACLENLGIQQQQLQKQQQKLQQQQELLEQQLQQHQHNASFARYNLANQVQPILLKKELVVSQSTGGGTQTVVSSVSKISPLPPPTLSCSTSSTPTLGHDIYGGAALELKNKPAVMNLSTGMPQVLMVQLDESNAQGATVTQLVKRDEPQPPLEVLDLTGQIKPENQIACCDVVYNLPFAGSCSGSFAQRNKPTDVNFSTEASQAPGLQPANIQGADERKSFTLPPPGRLPPSMSEDNLTNSGLQYYQRTDPGDLAVDLSTMKQAYEAGYLGMGAQYGSYTDLRHQGDDSAPPLPLRRYGSMSNINAEYGYPSRDLGVFQESNLAQYSATTAREISRMCAALNSMEQFGSRYTSNPELLQYGAGRGGPAGRLNLQQGLASIRANLLYGPDGRPTMHSQTLTNLINARQASLRSLYPQTVRTADGMIYSTINTPIASTLPITTQPAPVLNPMLRGVYGPSTNVTAVPLATLTRLPQVTPRMPLTSQGPYRYPSPNHFSATGPETSSVNAPPAGFSQQDAPVYLGKPATSSSMSTTSPNAGQTSAVAGKSVVNEQGPLAHISAESTTTQLQPQTQPQSLVKGQEQSQAQCQSQTQPQTVPQKQTQRVFPDTAASTTITTYASTDKEKEEERLRLQQEQLLHLERERVELEKLRQLRLQEELERDRIELQRHREKEHILMQREIQELQNIKQQVIHQQQSERETQLVMQREQLAQQRMQLDQIQSLQQQLQQQLEEQKRQKRAAIEAAAAAADASATAAVAATTAQGGIQGVMVGGASPQTISIIYDQIGRIIPQEGQSVQILPCADGQVVQAVVSTRPLPSSASEMSLKSEDQADGRIMKKQNSMPRLRNGTEDESVKRIADSSVQTDDEDNEDKLMSRRRRTRRIADCSVQTDEEDQGEWDNQPIRRRRSRYSKHSDSSSDPKSDASKVTSSIAIQTSNDSSCQTESDQLGRISPAIHITMAETSKVELLHYISAPERTHKGESLACQTDPEAQSQGVVAPQLSVPTTVSPYSTSLQLVGGTPTKFERRKPDPLDIGYQQNESPSRHPPKSPQVLYSPVSPLSPHRMLETTFTSSEKLNKAHVTPQQKAFNAESPQRHQTVPRPIKNVQRSLSDPKPLSPTSEDPSKTKFSLYQNQAIPGSQMSALQQNSMMRKVKRTLPSPPPDETPLPIVTPAIPQIYNSPGMSQRVIPRSAHGAMKAGLLSELKAVEQESSKLRKQQAELEEEEKEIDAKLRCLEMGITQRKETRVKERERRELAYIRCIGDARDYMSDSELNNLRLAGVAAGAYEENGLLSRPSTTHLNQYTADLNASQYPPTSSYVPYQYPQSQPTQPPTAPYQQIGFQPPQYPTSSQPQPGTFQPHPPQPSSYQNQAPYPTHGYSQPPYESDIGLQQPSHQGFQPPTATLPSQTLPYPSQGLSYQPQPDMHSVHQRPRQTSLADLEQKLPTNYEVISNPSVPIATSAQETGFSGAYTSPLNNAYGQYRTSDQPLTERIQSPSSGYVTDGVYATNLEQNIPRNYVMIDDISELTKENMGSSDMSRGYGNENGTRGPSYGDGSENMYGRTTSTYQNAVDSHGHPGSNVSSSGYYYDDYKHSSRSSGGMGNQKHSSKNLAPAVSSKRSKHRKQGMEQKISKFSPIEEARDVESDLASYTMTTSTGGSCTVVSRTGRKSYDQQKYYGSREALEEDDRLYGSGRSRSTGYGMDKISSRDSSGYRSKSYERDAMERSQGGMHSRSGRPSMRTQNSEEESPLSPVGKPMGIGRGSVPDPHDTRNQYGSSHSLPDVQDHHMRDVPKSHVYKPDDPYLADDMHCAVSDSEAYHLGQEETDWFEKPREARSRHHGSGGHSSSGRRSNVKHTYHDYDEPPEEDLWPQDEYGHQRHSSSSRDHRHHGSSSGRHSSSRHASDDPRSSRSSRSHPKDPSARSDSRVNSSSSQKRSSDPRSASQRDSGDYSRDPSGNHQGSSGQRGQRQPGSSRRQEPPSGSRQQHGEQPPPSQHEHQRSTPGQQSSAKQPGPQPPEATQQGQQQLGQTTRTQQQSQQPATTMGATQPTTTVPGTGTGTTQQQPKPGQAPTQARQQPGGPPTAQPAAPMAKPETAAPAAAPTPAVAIGSKAAPQTAKIPQAPVTGIGSKATPRPGGIGSAAQPPAEGDNVLTKILQGGAAEQAGKLGDAVSALGKKFTSFW
ncbi:protein bassoon [Triplophysa dalaica]|uniref:protein bassoon n=1 Tax=Triplophysa dalaica TaxID=1582913 RepID=UPI0024DF7025|nr:protein bassoon [Triplophysa dalaica]